MEEQRAMQAQPQSGGVTFSSALVWLKDGNKAAREGWNGKGQFVQAQFPDENSKMQMPYLYLHNAQGQLVPWLPSQGDLFGEDWIILDR